MKTSNFILSLHHFMILFIFLGRVSRCQEDETTTEVTGAAAEEEEEPEPLPKPWKCCPQDQFFNFATHKCDSSTDVNLNSIAIDSGIYSYLEDILPRPEDVFNYSNNFEVRGNKYPTCTYGYELFPFYNSSQYLILLKKSSLYLTFSEESLVYSDFCVDRWFDSTTLQSSNNASSTELGSNGTVVAFCRPLEEISCNERPCVQSCCPLGEVFNAQKRDCNESKLDDKSEKFWNPDIHNKQTGDLMSIDELTTYWNITEEKIGPTFPIRIFYSRFHSCNTQLYNLTSENKIFMDGTLFAGDKWFNYSEFCVQNIEIVEENSTVTFWKQAKVCVPDNPETQRYKRWSNVVDLTMIPSLLVISVVFLVLLFIHFWIRNRSKLFGAMMLSTIATLASFYICLSVIKFSGRNFVKSHPTTCITLGFLVQFTNLSSFYWLNTICFDIWLTFRKIKGSQPRKKSVFGKQFSSLGFANPKFKWYAIYAWGIPLIVVSITILIQYLPDRLTVDLVMPSIGKGQCLFGTNKSTLLYLHIINAPVLFANLILFLSFVYNLCCGIWSKSTDMIERNHHATNLRTVIKIFFVMGLTWIAEIVSFILNWSFGPAKTYKYVVLFDVINAMQGFTMFCVLFFDMDTIKMIKAKIGLKPASANNESTVRTFVSKVSFLTIPTSTSQISIVEETFPSSN